MYNELNSIWENGSQDAVKATIERKKSDSVESILFTAWSDTVQKMYRLVDEEEIWKLAAKEKKLAAFNGKNFSFENFRNEVLRKMN